ncbi:MAG: flavin-containing monooxygenase, partial [Alphaproteobacteria bacterium]
MPDTAPLQTTSHPHSVEYFDVLIVGAGISGIGAAYHLTTQCPDKRFVVLENEESFGGTWWTHKYPGIRSDSDLHTFGYRFKPWRGAPIATAEEILSYMGEVIAENDLARHIRYRHHITHASWDSQTRLWTLEVLDKATGLPRRFTGKFLYMCQGYYRHRQGYMPEWPNMAAYQGQLVHSEEWPEGLDYTDKQVLVIGSGASAATIIPAMAAKAAHVVMLQRSPTFFRVGRNAIEIAEELRTLGVSEDWIHEITRRKILFEQDKFAKMSFSQPDKVKEALLDGIRGIVGQDYDIATHFTPRYRPWRQRVAFV